MKKNILFISLLILWILKSAAQTFPPGFSQIKIATVYFPTSFAFAPDGRIFVCEKGGKVKVIKNGVILGIPFLQVPVDMLNERGLSSIAFDPDFTTNHYIYIYYTTASAPIRNRLSRFTANGDLAVAGSEVVIKDFDPCVNSIHNSGAMVFGTDGTLYLSVGNDNVNSYSQDINNLKGKILRINKDFSVPPGNPFTGSEEAKRIWSLGLRNPWTMSVKPGTNKIFVNEVGEGSWEEINDATTGGKNFGWPGSQGMTSNPAYTSPLHTYSHSAAGSAGGCAITGGAFFNPVTTNYPSQYAGKYFFIDYCNDWINYLDLEDGNKQYNFATNLPGSQNYIRVGPDGNLYYFSINTNSLYKIIYTTNNAPSITDQPDNFTVAAGQPASFTVSASGAAPLAYQWQKNNIDIAGANGIIYTVNNAQEANEGSYRVKVSNSSGTATSNAAILTVTTFNAKPVANIITPAIGTNYRDGDIISFSGDAADQENGTLPATAFTWEVEFHHAIHSHPGPSAPDGVKTGSFTASFGGETAANVFFRLKLIVTDSGGLKDTAFVDITPITSMLALVSQPSGLQLLLEAQPQTTPYSVLAVSGSVHELGVISPQTFNGRSYVFDKWLHGGNASQNIAVADSNKTYTAVFKDNGLAATCTASGSITRDYWANITGTTVASIPVNATPTSTSQLTIFEGPSHVANNGSRIHGYICPPQTGNYIFWIASDNSSELWLSTNDQPSNKIKIASVTGNTRVREWNKFPSQMSAPISLTAGVKYYIETLHKENSEGDNLAVGWQMPNGVQERPIPGSRLSPFTTVPGGITYTPNTFAVIGDYGSSGPDEAAVANLVKSWSPELIITTGDNNYPSGEASTIDVNIGQYYHDYIKPYSGSYGNAADVNRFFPGFGNHDAITDSGFPYFQYFTLPGNERYYDFVKGNIHFFAINSEASDPDGNSSTSAQAMWLQNKLAASTAKWKVVYFHYSPYCSDQVHGSVAVMQWPFKTWGADIVLTGHSHVYERIVKDSFPYLVNGLGGRSKYALTATPVSGSQFRYNENFGAMKVMVTSDTIWFRFYNISNTLIDSYPLVKLGTPPPSTTCASKITPAGSTTFCTGSVLLKGTQGAEITYQWKKDGTNIPGATSINYTASTAGDYQLKISFTGCNAWSAPMKVTINTSLVAKITAGGPTTFCIGGNVKLYANTCNGYVYQWKKNGADIPGATSAIYTATASGSYQVKIIQGASVAWSALVIVTVNGCAEGETERSLQTDSVAEEPIVKNENFHVNVYPNPTTGLFSFELCMEETSEQTMEIRVISSTGQTVYNKQPQVINGCVRETIELENMLSAGIYILQIRIGDNSENTKLVLNR